MLHAPTKPPTGIIQINVFELIDRVQYAIKKRKKVVMFSLHTWAKTTLPVKTIREGWFFLKYSHGVNIIFINNSPRDLQMVDLQKSHPK